MRITTNMVMRNYNNNLSATLGGLESSRKQVETNRRFSSSYEDPASSAKAAILERRYARNADYLNNVENVQKWQDTQEDIATQLSNIAKEIDKRYSVEALNDTNADLDTRKVYAQTLRGLQEQMVQTLNTRYGETFAVAGAGGKEQPFELTADGVLTYRGVDVNSDDPNDQKILEELSQEATYIDLGLGLGEDGAEVSSSTAFNSALPGINLVGYGKDEQGVSKNLVVLVGQMADALEEETFDRDAYEAMWENFSEGSSQLRDEIATLGTKTQMLTQMKTRLESEKLAITEQYDNAVNIDPAEAIMNYSWSMYAYNTALKVGTSIITPSLLDFLN
ncbi:hypothetical protein H9L42_00665 [Mogibacterium sp. BX12]|uniref:Flagellin n=2 Tax=Zhenpiania hominis TaxID=2763644 RepID=A0A923SUG0_9FIRM|nr:hypothetical protein [Zhenpiania hominis]